MAEAAESIEGGVESGMSELSAEATIFFNAISNVFGIKLEDISADDLDSLNKWVDTQTVSEKDDGLLIENNNRGVHSGLGWGLLYALLLARSKNKTVVVSFNNCIDWPDKRRIEAGGMSNEEVQILFPEFFGGSEVPRSCRFESSKVSKMISNTLNVARRTFRSLGLAFIRDTKRELELTGGEFEQCLLKAEDAIGTVRHHLLVVKTLERNRDGAEAAESIEGGVESGMSELSAEATIFFNAISNVFGIKLEDISADDLDSLNKWVDTQTVSEKDDGLLIENHNEGVHSGLGWGLLYALLLARSKNKTVVVSFYNSIDSIDKRRIEAGGMSNKEVQILFPEFFGRPEVESLRRFEISTTQSETSRHLLLAREMLEDFGVKLVQDTNGTFKLDGGALEALLFWIELEILKARNGFLIAKILEQNREGRTLDA